MSSTTEAERHAQRLLETTPADVREALGRRPLETLTGLGFELRYRQLASQAGCDLSASFQLGPPPVITLSSADSPSRLRFSALHEYGHALVHADTDIHDAFFARPDNGRRLEEDVCHAVAAHLLLPDQLVDAVIGQRGPTAASVARLIETSSVASAAACCVRAAGRLRASGHVMLARDGTAVFTAAHDTDFRVRRGTPQGVDHLVAKAATLGRARGRSHLVYASGAHSEPFEGDAVQMSDGLVVAVFASNKAAWIMGYQPPTAPEHVGFEAVCPHCDTEFAAFGAPCTLCGEYPHRGRGGCDRCSCAPTPVAERTCTECFLQRAISNFSADSTVCRDCS